MEPISNLQCLLQRQSEIRDAMRRPGGIRITVERELLAIQEKLKRIPTLMPNGHAGDELSTRLQG